MDKKSEHYLIQLSSIHTSLARVYDETLEYWLPDPPPLTVAYGDIGREIAEGYQKIDPTDLKNIFHIIECGLESGEEPLGTAITTGLIEALVGRAARQDGVWEKIRPYLGPQAVQHADGWLKWEEAL